MSTFGEYLRIHREQKGLTQDRFARHMEIPYTDVSKIERGKKKFPFAKLKELADFLELDFKYLKNLFVADLLVEQANKYNCSDTVFSLAEEHAKYVRKVRAKQS